MNIIKAYFLGFREAVRLPRPVFLIYFINLMLGVMIILPFYGIMDAQIGESIEAKSLIKSFDYSILADFYNNSQAGISLLLGQIKWTMFVYWIMSIFLAGGIIRTLNQDKFSMTSFFSGAGYSFFRFFKISIVMLIIHIFTLLLVYIPTFLIIGAVASNPNSETTVIAIFFTGFVIHILLMLILLMTNDYSKFYSALYDTSKTFKAIKGGFSYVFKNFIRTYSLYLMLVIIPALLVYAYFRVNAELGTTTKFGIIIMFFVQQAFIILRIWFRVWTYSSPLQMFTADFLKNDDVIAKIAIMNEWQDKASQQNKHVLADIMQTEEEKSDAGVITEKELLKRMEADEFPEKELMKKVEAEISAKAIKNQKKKENTTVKETLQKKEILPQKEEKLDIKEKKDISPKKDKKEKDNKDKTDKKNNDNETYFEL